MTERSDASRQRPRRAALAPERPVLIVAVDGVLADTLPLRAAAFNEVQRAVPGHVARDVSAHDVIGVSWEQLAQTVGPADDVTLVDLLALAAERAWGRMLATRAPLLFPEAIARTRACAEDGWRVLLRADSSRRAAAALFELLAEQTLATRVIAGDDVRVSDDASLREAQYARLLASVGRARVHVVEPEAPHGVPFTPALDGVAHDGVAHDAVAHDRVAHDGVARAGVTLGWPSR